MIENFEKLVAQKLTSAVGEIKDEVVKKSPASAASSTSTPATSQGTLDIDGMKQDLKFAKYFKMISVGVPKPSVYAKMSGEGMSPTSFNRFK